MYETTAIESEEVSVSTPADSLIVGIFFKGNKKILFLPLRVDLKFSGLELYTANDCAIEKISKRNFKNLNRLTNLWLDNNQIEYVSSDAFEDLIAMKKINMSKKYFSLSRLHFS